MKNSVLAFEYNFINSMNSEIVKVDYRQLTKFSNKWVQVEQQVKAKKVAQKLQEKELVKNLASDPLLKLLCLVFEETSNIPSNRSRVYEEGLEILLKKWDDKRHVEGDQIYKNLSLRRKQDLLSKIAFKTFEGGEYFLKKDLEQYIVDYIGNLPNAQTHPEVLELESEAVLKSIEAQHGLLVELSEGNYCFSELKFHQYFTAREIVESPDPQKLEKALKKLVSHMSEPGWREVFLLVVEMLQDVDYLLRLMKHQTDAIVASDEELQQFLLWLNRKSNSGKTAYRPSTFRAFYLEFILDTHKFKDNLAYNHSINPVWSDPKAHELQNLPFSAQQKAVLKEYYDANKLVLDCLNSACYVTRSLRIEIKEALLVPSELSS